MSMTSASKYWIVQLRDDKDRTGGVSSVNDDLMAFNTLKFLTYGGALAFCRRRDYDPRDYVIVLAEFQPIKVIERREINYTTSEIFVAVSPEQSDKQ